jgi:hypothetical protein
MRETAPLLGHAYGWNRVRLACVPAIMDCVRSFAMVTAAVLSLGGAAAGCALSGASCTPPAGGRCEGPLPLARSGADNQIRLGITPDGRTLTAVVPCGGSLRIRQGSQVRLTWIASAVGAGGMSCASIALTAVLAQPLGGRELLDGATGTLLRPIECPSAGRAMIFSSCR